MVLYILTFTFLDSRREGEPIINIYIYSYIYIDVECLSTVLYRIV
jgi:hypothetical protein